MAIINSQLSEQKITIMCGNDEITVVVTARRLDDNNGLGRELRLHAVANYLQGE
ncbi:MAG: hypothetical protein OEQ39_18495 [Gammaproteobacteria bacterium]|nr:hypothetical protein [Gammaproteobacteria bacterium]